VQKGKGQQRAGSGEKAPRRLLPLLPKPVKGYMASLIFIILTSITDWFSENCSRSTETETVEDLEKKIYTSKQKRLTHF
jgi:hypothetical protein